MQALYSSHYSTLEEPEAVALLFDRGRLRVSLKNINGEPPSACSTPWASGVGSPLAPCGVHESKNGIYPTLSRSLKQKPFRDFSRKKRQLMAWSLRATPASARRPGKHLKQVIHGSSNAPRGPHKDSNVEEFFEQLGQSKLQHLGCRDVDVDTLPTLAPYRREVVAQQPTTFGHRPLSASRMFNPTTMETTFNSVRAADGFGLSREMTRAGKRRARGPAQYILRPKARANTLRTPGLSAPMLKELLLLKKRPGELTKREQSVSRVSHLASVDTSEDYPRRHSAGPQLYPCRILDIEDMSRGQSRRRSSEWGMRKHFDATRSTPPGEDAGERVAANKKESAEAAALRRIFCTNVRLLRTIA